MNFGELTRRMIKHQLSQDGVNVTFNTEVYDLKRAQDGRWNVSIKDLKTGTKRTIVSKFVFIGAGGASILLFQRNLKIRKEKHQEDYHFRVNGWFVKMKN